MIEILLGGGSEESCDRVGAQTRTHGHGYTVRFVVAKGGILGEGLIMRGLLWWRMLFGERYSWGVMSRERPCGMIVVVVL